MEQWGQIIFEIAGINVALRLVFFGLFSKVYGLIKGTMFIFWTFFLDSFQGLL